jgi:TrmH family RNA methyltransferase
VYGKAESLNLAAAAAVCLYASARAQRAQSVIRQSGYE